MELKNKRKKFSKDFKDSAVRLVDGGKSAAQVARELDLPVWQVQNWVRESKKTTVSGDTALVEENKRLKKELERKYEK